MRFVYGQQWSKVKMSRIGLVLSGGAAKCAYQVGILKALREYIAPTDLACVSAASGGTLNAYTYLTEQLSYAEEQWKTTIAGPESRFFGRLLRGNVLQKIVEGAAEKGRKIPCTFFTSLYNFSRNRLLYVDLQKIPDPNKHLRASVSIPVLANSVHIDNEKYFDGGVVDNIPVSPLLAKDLDYIICIYFDQCNYLFESKEFDDKVIKIIFSDKRIASDFLFFKTEMVEELIDSGYRDGKNIFSELFANGKDDVEYIRTWIGRYNEEHPIPKLRITADFVVANLNKVMRKLSKKHKVVE